MPSKSTRTAILLHGLGRSPRSMAPIANALRDHGYEVANIGYASRSAPIAELARTIAQRIASVENDHALDFVTHSLGGILLRVAVAEGMLPVERIRRVVMLGPPNGGSEIVGALGARPIIGRLYRGVTGPAGAELGARPADLPSLLPSVAFELGVIAGDRSINPLLSRFLPGPNDGKVRVERAAVVGMRDLIVLPYPHPLLMRAPVAIRQTIHFLEQGAFDHEVEPLNFSRTAS